MKKSAIIALTVLLSLGLIIPAMAADLKVSGDFRARGFYKSNAEAALTENGHSDAYYDFRIRPVLTFKVNEKLSITTRMRIFDEQFGTNASKRYVEGTVTGKSDVARWEYAWATWVTDYGQLDVGRMKGGLFGLSLFETEAARDRIKWTTKVGDVALLGIIEKNREDVSTGGLSDNDSEAYYLAGIYNSNNAEVGCLLGQIRDEGATSGIITSYMLINPYFDLKKLADGNLSVKGEIQNRTGVSSPKAGGTDTDISAMGFYLAGSYDFGDFDLELGYANVAGDDESGDNEIGSLGGLGTVNSGLGDEWTPLVILQDVNQLLGEGTVSTTDFGGSGQTGPTMSTGVSLIYLCANYDINDKVKVSAVFGNATPNAEKVDNTGAKIANSDEPFGNEIDLKLNWKLTDDLTYFFNFGYLMAGDFFKSVTSEPENTHTIYHGIELDF